MRNIPPVINTSIKRARNYWPGQTGKNLKKIISIAALFIVALIGAYSLSEYIARQLYPQNTGAPMQLGSPFTLTAHTGEAITEQAFQGTPSAVFSALPIARKYARPR